MNGAGTAPTHFEVVVRSVLAAVLLFLACDNTVFPEGETGSSGQLYAADWDGVQAFVVEECSACHMGSGGLPQLPEDIEDDVLDGKGQLVVPGDPEASVLWQVLISQGGGDEPATMPPDGPLPFEELQHIRLWILDGAEL